MNPAAEPMQVESSGGSSVAGGGIGAGVDVVYPTPLPILTTINVFMERTATCSMCRSSTVTLL